MRNINVQTPTNPVLIDDVLIEISVKLKEKLPWLNTAYGKVKRLIERKENTTYFYPAMQVNEGEYRNMLPDSHLGNYSFFDITDGDELEDTGRTIRMHKRKGGLVFWFDYRKVFPESQENESLENVKLQVLTVLRSMTLRKSRITLRKVWEQANNIYPSYTSHEIESQFLMYPFGGFRIDFEISFDGKKC